MNHMAEVAKMLGVELGEKFKIADNCNDYLIDDTFYFTDKDIIIDGTDRCADLCILYGLLIGNLTIKRKPWQPKHGDYYWVVHCDGYVYKMCYCGSNEDKTFYKLGNCYRTCEEAEANRDKWVNFYVSDEVLEV